MRCPARYPESVQTSRMTRLKTYWKSRGERQIVREALTAEVKEHNTNQAS
jgi:hypothetical protein